MCAHFLLHSIEMWNWKETTDHTVVVTYTYHFLLSVGQATSCNSLSSLGKTNDSEFLRFVRKAGDYGDGVDRQKRKGPKQIVEIKQMLPMCSYTANGWNVVSYSLLSTSLHEKHDLYYTIDLDIFRIFSILGNSN